MDKTTKAFVIAACCVVIAVPVSWIADGFLMEWNRLANIRENEEKVRQIRKDQKTAQKRSQRIGPCIDRSNELFPTGTGNSSEFNREQFLLTRQKANRWTDKCISSTAPVDGV